MRRLVVCCDGTWNKDDQKSPTNVVKMARATLPVDAAGNSQLVYYHAGVGTGNTIDQFEGGAIGEGLEANVQDGYRFVVDNYTDGDEVFLFGFSRGAYTARSIAGFIRKCGILRKIEGDRTAEAARLYRKRDEGADSAEAVAFRAAYSREIRIKFIGVWDTVGALGIPTGPFHTKFSADKFAFHDVKLSRSIQNAYHALAIDEKRKPFEPTLWETTPGADQKVEQRWFAGAHSNVGGGYDDTGLSDIAFEWMATKAASCGLALDPAYVRKMVAPNAAGALINSSAGIKWFFLGSFVRPVAAHPEWNETVDATALQRADNSGLAPRYAPSNLVAWRSAQKPQVLAGVDAPMIPIASDERAVPRTRERRDDTVSPG
jgi:uncharacterized protein (DUF2235 family)